MKTGSKTFFIVAGEESGDIHGARLMAAIKEIIPHSRFIGHGGDRMISQGLEVMENVNRLAMIGFTEVIRHLPFMFRVMKQTISRIKAEKPDRIILIDYPGFNLRLAQKVSTFNIPVSYFILPQVWAWKENRAEIIRNHVDQAISIFPFEKKWFDSKNIPCEYVGHPFAELESPRFAKDEFFQRHNLDPGNPVLALMPGSRQQEVDRHWPVYLDTINLIKEKINNLQVIVGKAPHVVLNENGLNIHVESEYPREILHYATAGLIASGTATLESAILGCPLVVSYRLSFPTWWMVNKMSKVKFASMVNLIAGKQVVQEFLQSDMSPEHLSSAIIPLLRESEERNSMRTEFEAVKEKLGQPGVYDRAAGLITNTNTKF